VNESNSSVQDFALAVTNEK